MISLKSKFASFPQGMCEYQASKDGRYGWFLCTLNEEKHTILEEIQTEVKLEILNSNVLDISKLEIEHWLQTFFADFHWKLHAHLRKTDLREKGLSLLFGVIFDNEIHYVQFGRIFCAVSKGKKLIQHGRVWKNHRVNSLEDLNLYGLSEADIRVKPQRLLLEDNERLLVVSAGVAAKVFEPGTDVSSLVPVIESFSGSNNALWLVLENVPRLQKTGKKKLNKLQISSFLLLFVTFLAILYMAFGNRFFDRTLRKASLQNIPDKIKVDPDILKYWEGVVNAPVRSIELSSGWTTDLPYKVTAAPAFDQANIYLASENNLIAFNKKSRNVLWNNPFPAPIVAILNTKYGLVVNLADNQLVGVTKEGLIAWDSKVETNIPNPAYLHNLELTNGDDPRIDGSITVIPLQKGISVVDSQRGTVLSELTLKERLQFLSGYDQYDSSFYAVVADAILCIELKIMN